MKLPAGTHVRSCLGAGGGPNLIVSDMQQAAPDTNDTHMWADQELDRLGVQAVWDLSCWIRLGGRFLFAASLLAFCCHRIFYGYCLPLLLLHYY
jgi:hypothetical protein